MSSQRLERIEGFVLVTDDPDRLVAFYVDVLGFVPDGAAAPIDPVEMAAIGLRGGGERRRLRIGDQSVSIERYDVQGRPYPDGSDSASLWFQHLALVVTDIGASFGRLAAFSPISEGGPQRLPESSGGVEAYKFRDPDGHPLEFLYFPPDGTPPPWRGRRSSDGIAVGIDHSAISVSDPAASVAFYEGLGLSVGDRTVNRGPAQQRLDDLVGVEVDVVPMQAPAGVPHLELLGYRTPRGAALAFLDPNDVAATRIVWGGTGHGVIADPDGHLHQILP